jgi:predicted unusual protein kinase regulating ubiquinone biosynthesis (AarF/ABC1/UbiB family)
MANLQIKHFNRYKDIIWLFIKYGRSDLVKEISADINLPPSEKDQTISENGPKPEELAEDLQRMGPTFVKLGQLLSTQTDILPDAYTEALVKLQDRADPFPYEEIEAIFLSELGIKIRDGFKEFDPTPIAAASLAQVHKAVLHSGREVAVKVQRPGIQAGIIEDLEVLHEIAGFLEARTSWGKRYGLVDKMHQLRSTLFNELDYTKEASNLITFKNNLKDFELILVPSPVQDYTRVRVLTMDFIPGRKITEISPLLKMEIDGQQLAEDLFHAYLKQILIDGFVHVDPHPGNIYLTADNHLVIYDLGMISRIPPHMQNALLKLLLSVSEGQGEDAADIIVKLGKATDDFNYQNFKNQIAQLISQYQDMNISQMAIGRVILKITGIGGEAGMIMPAQFSMLGKALLNLDKVGKTLAPHFNPNESIRNNAAELMNQRMRKNFTTGSFYRTFIEATELIQHLPTKLNNLMDILSRNELKLNVDAFDERRLMVGCEKIANRITLGLVLAALIIGAALLMRIETPFTIFGYPGLAMILFLAAAIGGLLLVFNILIYDEKKNVD